MSKKNKLKKIEKKLKTEEIRVFKQFQKQKIFNQISFVLAALVMAFGINSFVLNGDFGNQLKTNILESRNTNQKADIYLEKENDLIKINIGKKMDQVKSISFSLVYNPENITIQDTISKIKSTKLIKLENEKGITTIIINFEKIQSLPAGTNIIELFISKNSNNDSQHLNIINSNFTDSTNTKYDLTTSGITF